MPTDTQAFSLIKPKLSPRLRPAPCPSKPVYESEVNYFQSSDNHLIHQNHAVSWVNKLEVYPMNSITNEPSLTLSDIEAQIADANSKLALLQVRLGLLNEFRDTLKGKRERLEPPLIEIVPPNGRNQAKPGISQGMRDFIAAHPFKYKRSEIIEIVKDQVATKAKDPASSMFSTLWQWVQQDKIEIDSEGRVGPVQEVHKN